MIYFKKINKGAKVVVIQRVMDCPIRRVSIRDHVTFAEVRKRTKFIDVVQELPKRIEDSKAEQQSLDLQDCGSISKCRDEESKKLVGVTLWFKCLVSGGNTVQLTGWSGRRWT